MRVDRTDPGECVVCGAAHCGCGGSATLEVVQLPARDAARAVEGKRGVFVAAASTSIFVPPAATPLGDGTDGRSFSTKTYRGDKTRKRR